MSDDTNKVGKGIFMVVLIPGREKWQAAKGKDCGDKTGMKGVMWIGKLPMSG